MPSLNRVVAFTGPYVSVVAAALATWIIAKANALGIAGLDQDATTQQIAAAITFILTAALSWAGQSKWLRGHQLWEMAQAEQQTQLLAQPQEPPTAPNRIPDAFDDDDECAPTVVDHAMVAEPAGIDDDTRPVMPSEIDLEGEPDEPELAA